MSPTAVGTLGTGSGTAATAPVSVPVLSRCVTCAVQPGRGAAGGDSEGAGTARGPAAGTGLVLRCDQQPPRHEVLGTQTGDTSHRALSPRPPPQPPPAPLRPPPDVPRCPPMSPDVPVSPHLHQGVGAGGGQGEAAAVEGDKVTSPQDGALGRTPLLVTAPAPGLARAGDSGDTSHGGSAGEKGGHCRGPRGDTASMGDTAQRTLG